MAAPAPSAASASASAPVAAGFPVPTAAEKATQITDLDKLSSIQSTIFGLVDRGKSVSKSDLASAFNMHEDHVIPYFEGFWKRVVRYELRFHGKANLAALWDKYELLKRFICKPREEKVVVRCPQKEKPAIKVGENKPLRDKAKRYYRGNLKARKEDWYWDEDWKEWLRRRSRERPVSDEEWARQQAYRDLWGKTWW